MILIGSCFGTGPGYIITGARLDIEKSILRVPRRLLLRASLKWCGVVL